LIFAINWQTAVCFVIGAIFSILAGYNGMKVATKLMLEQQTQLKKRE